MALPLLTAAEMRAQDAAAIEKVGLGGPVLMESAGRAAAEEALRLLGGRGRAAVLCGRGNNGGDGMVVARYLAQKNLPCRVVVLGQPASLSADATRQAQILERLGIAAEFITEESALEALDLSTCDLIIDAVLGTGLSSNVHGLAARAIEKINRTGRMVLALDLPSGINSDTGTIMGRAVRATLTVTFGYLKPGLLLHPGGHRLAAQPAGGKSVSLFSLDRTRCRGVYWQTAARRP
jgi:hydroxyethylthiazole kinase-like uncharacterized protein yjeF